jgi:hypothetical protein
MKLLKSIATKDRYGYTYTSGCAYYGLTIDLDVAIPLKRHNRARQCGYISSVQNG